MKHLRTLGLIATAALIASPALAQQKNTQDRQPAYGALNSFFVGDRDGSGRDLPKISNASPVDLRLVEINEEAKAIARSRGAGTVRSSYSGTN